MNKQRAYYYSLEKKIASLDTLEKQNNSLTLTSRLLGISITSLTRWKHNEATLRKEYKAHQGLRCDRMIRDLHMRMIARAQAILERMEDDALAEAPLNQLTFALNTLLSQALKLQVVIEENEEEPEKERVIRFEHYYDGKVQDVPPWENACKECGSPLRSPVRWEDQEQNGAESEDDPADETTGSDMPDDQPSV